MTLPPYTKTAVAVVAMLAVGLPKRGGSWLIVLLPAVAACSVYALVRMAMRPAERRTRAIQLAAWVLAVALVGATQAHWSAASRRQAEAVLAAVLGHEQRTGALPSTLAQVGLDDAELSSRWRLTYRLRDGDAELSYPAQLLPISTHDYDFKARRWTLNVY